MKLKQVLDFDFGVFRLLFPRVDICRCEALPFLSGADRGLRDFFSLFLSPFLSPHLRDKFSLYYFDSHRLYAFPQ